MCWDINLSEIKNNEEVTDIAKQRRILKIIPPENEGDYTRYYLDYPRGGRKIEIFVLKSYLKEKLKIEFFFKNRKIICLTKAKKEIEVTCYRSVC